MSKRKGINAERELLHLFWKTGEWIALRAPGSGSMRYPCPDLLVGNARRKLAIECKTTKNNRQYISRKQIDDLQHFANIFGAEPWVAVRFDTWYFIAKEDLQETTENFVISKDFAKYRGFSFDELQGKFS